MDILSVLKEEQQEYKFLKEETQDNTGASVVTVPSTLAQQSVAKPTSAPREQKKPKLKYLPQGSLERTIQLIQMQKEVEARMQAQMAAAQGQQAPQMEEFNIKQTIRSLRGAMAGLAMTASAMGAQGGHGSGSKKVAPPTPPVAKQVVGSDKEKEQDPDASFEWETPTIGAFMDAIASQEHKGGAGKDVKEWSKDYAKRTEVSKEKNDGKVSTAFGRFQLTGDTLKDQMTRHPELFKDVPKKYLDAFLAQADKFRTADEKDPVYGLGGGGDLQGQEHYDNYLRAVQAVVRGKGLDRKIDMSKPGFDMDSAIHGWRGVTAEKDPGYYSGVKERYTSNMANLHRKIALASTVGPMGLLGMKNYISTAGRVDPVGMKAAIQGKGLPPKPTPPVQPSIAGKKAKAKVKGKPKPARGGIPPAGGKKPPKGGNPSGGNSGGTGSPPKK